MSDDLSGDYLICADVATVDDPLPGSAERWCVICGTGLWVSPGNLAGVDAGDLKPLCEECVTGMPEHPIHLTQGSIDALHQVGLSDAQIRVITEFQRAYIAAKRTERKP